MTSPGAKPGGLHPLARDRIRAARVRRRMSQRELGRRTGLSASMLSQIENGKSEPSVSTLYAVASELGMSLDTLLDPVPRDTDQRSGDRPIGGRHPEDGTTTEQVPATGEVTSRGGPPVVTPAERRTLYLDSGVAWERLTRGHSDVDVLLATYEPGGVSTSTGAHITRRGREFAYLIEGHLTVEIGRDTYELRAGDSLEFDPSIPHLVRNTGRRPASGVWLLVHQSTANRNGAT